MFDQLTGVDFNKGCFVGQEVVSRMEHRGTARKRIVGVEGEGPLPRFRHRHHRRRRADRHARLGERQLGACASASRPCRGGEGRRRTVARRRGDRRLAHSCLGALQDPRAGSLMSKAQAKRCPWAGTDPLYIAYHDEEWGVPKSDARALFEKLVLEGFQAGLSWITILRKREAFRAAFDNFDAREDGALRTKEGREPAARTKASCATAARSKPRSQMREPSSSWNRARASASSCGASSTASRSRTPTRKWPTFRRRRRRARHLPRL